MKDSLKFLAMAAMAGAIFTACNGNDKPGPGPGPTGNYPENVTVTTATEGPVKAGMAGAVTITGSGFEDDDYIFIGYPDGAETTYERISGDVLELRATRISFGAPMTAPYLDKTFKVYLDRAGYDRMPLTKDINFVMPDIADGYIPDAGFRATLQSTHPQDGNPAIAACFNTYGLLDVAAVAKLTHGGNADGHALYLAKTTAKNLQGIELLSGITGNVAGWGMTTLEEADMSKWEAKEVTVFFQQSSALKKFAGPPYAYRIDIQNCNSLTHVDLSACKWCYNLQLWYDDSPTTFTYVTYLDIRRQKNTKLCPSIGAVSADYPHNAATDYAVFGDSSWMKVAENCKILVDYQFLLDKTASAGTVANPFGSNYGTIFQAWQRGATIEVYKSDDIKTKIGTVPMYSVDPGALTMTGANGWTPAT